MSKIKTIAIDIGHNVTHDIGAKGIEFEDDLNKKVGERLIQLLKETNLNVINCTPKEVPGLLSSLKHRCIKANQNEAEIFISIHHNAYPGGYGCEALCIPGGIAETTGKQILKEISKLGLRNRGIKNGEELYVIKHTSMPALLIECAFVDSYEDMYNYNPNNVADAIFTALVTVFELKPETNQNQQIYIVVKGDTLWGISRKFNTTVDKLVALNGISDKDFITVGQRLVVG